LEKYAKLISDAKSRANPPVTYNDWSQLGAQLIGSSTNFVFVGLFALIWFRLSNALIPLRSKRDDEFVGLDIPELGGRRIRTIASRIRVRRESGE
jgi:ammonia channel protein AmtB